jgi:hypothetical protein
VVALLRVDICKLFLPGPVRAVASMGCKRFLDIRSHVAVVGAGGRPDRRRLGFGLKRARCRG